MIHGSYGFDCKCPVCSGEVPNQDDIMMKMGVVIFSNRLTNKEKDEMTVLDWTREAIAFGAIVELAKPVYMEREEVKMAKLKAAIECDQPSHIVKAVNAIKELTEN